MDIARTPESPIAQHIRDQTRTISRFRRPSPAARPQKGDDDILGHPCVVVPLDKAVIRVLVVEAVVRAVFYLFVRRVVGSVSVGVWSGGGSGAGEESSDPLVRAPLPRGFAVPGT